MSYSRDVKIIDIMEALRFIESINGEGYRNVLITPEKFKEYFDEDFV